MATSTNRETKETQLLTFAIAPDPSIDEQWLVGFALYQINRHVIVAQGEDRGLPIGYQPLNGNDSNSPTDLLYNDKYENTVYAFYSSFNFTIDPTFDFQLDLRYDSEARTADNLVPATFDTDSTTPGTQPGIQYLNPGLTEINPAPLGGVPTTTNTIPSRSKTFSQFQPKIGFSYRPDDVVNFYANIGVGFRSGGFNSLGSEATIRDFYCPENAIVAADMIAANCTNTGTNEVFRLGILNVRDEYDQEVSTSGEIGVKLNLHDGAVGLEFSAYQTTVEDLQFFNFLVGPFGLLRVITNIDEAEITGFEMAGSFDLGGGISLNMGYSLIDSEIKKNTNRPYTTGNKVPFAPEDSYTFGFQFKEYINDGSQILISADHTYTGDTWFGEAQSSNANDNLPNQFTRAGFGFTGPEKTKRDGFGLTNMRIGFIQDSGWSITLWSNNLFNTEYLAEVIPATEFGGSFVHQAPLRTYGIEVTGTY